MSTPTPIADIEIFRHAQNLVSSRSYARSQTPLKPLRPSQISLVPTNLRVGPQKRQRQRKPLLKQEEEESGEDEESEESDEEDLEGLTTEELEARELCAWAKDLDGPNRPRSKSRSKSRLQPEPLECIGSAALFRKELLAQSRSQARSQPHSQDSENNKKSQVLLATPAKTTTPNSKPTAQSSPDATTTTPVTTTTTPTSKKKKSSSTSKKRKRASTSPPSDLDSPVASASAPGQLDSSRRFGYDGNEGTILSASQPLPARKSLLPFTRYTRSIAGYTSDYGR
jgi:hypothetical protein